MQVTGRGGLLPYLDLMAKVELWELAGRLVKARSGSQGWSDGQLVAGVVLVNLAGGSCVDDLRLLESDAGLGALVRQAEVQGMSRQERRAFERRHRKGRQRALPSESALRRFLEASHDESYEAGRKESLAAGVKAYIPKPNAVLSGLMELNAEVVSKMLHWAPLPVATLDMDATLVETTKDEALFCYKHFRAYQPLNVWLAERQLMLWSEFRDGNVPAGHEQLRVFQDALGRLPSSVGKVRLRSDSAGYQWDLLKYCAEGQNKRFGVIDFAVSADVSKEFRQAVHETPSDAWQPLVRRADGMEITTGQEWAEVCFVPNQIGHKKGGPVYRFLAIREPLRQLELSGVEPTQQALPFPVIEQGGVKYKLFGVVTNLEQPGDEVIWWLRERCGKSEEAHSIMKSDLAGGTLPSKFFGANAAWWQIMLLAFNFNSAMKHLVLGGAWASRRLKALRFGFINVVGRIVHHARHMVMKLASCRETTELIIGARQRILALAPLSG
ncbi:MAG: IS1380 family transposase [Myxococcota bacterium]|nr:IS1380 family transposase [Myxococcota bacterium]